MSATRSTNIHEAGHGVMTVLVGFLTQYITNIPDETSGGRMYWATGQRTPFAIVHGIATSEARARALIYVAGVAAVRVILAQHDELRGADDTCARAFAKTISANEDAAVRELLADAGGIFANEHVRNATIAIADQLDRERVVSGSDIERRIDDVGLLRMEPLRFDASRTERRANTASATHAAVLGNSAFLDAASPQYFFNERRSK